MPKPLRTRYNISAGTVVDVVAEADGILLRVAGSEPSLITEQGVLVHHGAATVDVDVAALIERERETRHDDLVPDADVAAERP